MVFMMGMGIVLRKFELVPLGFIAVFYTGLKAELLLAGINFMYYFIHSISHFYEMSIGKRTKCEFFHLSPVSS